MKFLNSLFGRVVIALLLGIVFIIAAKRPKRWIKNPQVIKRNGQFRDA